jgi:hypothetical protein
VKKYWFIVCLPALLTSSCLNPFAPKLDTELASQQCGDLTNVENVFCSFRNAYSFKDTSLYGTLIAPDFTFIYTDYDRAVDISWGRDDEMRVTYALFQNVQSLTLIWNTEISFSATDTVQSVERGYNLSVSFDPSNIVRVDGYADLTFVRRKTGDPWKIVRWRDRSNF